MAAPDKSEYGTAAAAAYTLQNSGGFTPPTGWTEIQTSPTTEWSDGFAAVALKDPRGNTIIAYEGSVVGLTTYDKGTLAADQQIMGAQSQNGTKEFSHSLGSQAGSVALITHQ